MLRGIPRAILVAHSGANAQAVATVPSIMSVTPNESPTEDALELTPPNTEAFIALIATALVLELRGEVRLLDEDAGLQADRDEEDAV